MYVCCPSPSCYTPPQGAWLHLLNAPSIATGELLLVPLEASFSLSRTSPSPAASPHSASAAECLGSPLLNSLQHEHISCTGSHKLDMVSRRGLLRLSVGDSHSL